MVSRVKFQLKIAIIVRDWTLCHKYCKCKSCENRQQKFSISLGKTLLLAHNMGQSGILSWPSIGHTHSDTFSTHLIADLPCFAKIRFFPQVAYFLSWLCQCEEFSNPIWYWVRQFRLSFWTPLHLVLLQKLIHLAQNCCSSFFFRSQLSALR